MLLFCPRWIFKAARNCQSQLESHRWRVDISSYAERSRKHFCSFQSLELNFVKNHCEEKMASTRNILVCMALSLFTVASGLSFEDTKQGRENYYNFIVESRAHGKKYDGRELREECKDRLPVKTCVAYKPLCSYYRIIREMCAESCSQCERAFLHVACEATKFGCCWDNFTKATGPKKEGCPACVDMHGDCKYLKDRCAERAAVRRVCPVTCGVRCQSCEDNPYQAEVCPYYKMAGFCQVDPILMKKHCSKTCGFCR